MDVQTYIENLALSEDIIIDEQMRGIELKPAKNELGDNQPTLPDNLQAAVSAGSLLSFVDGINSQDTQDVLDCVQLASRVASKKHDRFTEVKNWYGSYLEVLENVGWAADQFAFATYDQDEGDLHMDKAALSLIATIATGNQLAILKKSIEALKSLSEGEKPIKVFEYYASAQTSGNFQLGSVQQGSNGTIGMAMGAFHFRSVTHKKKFLFFSWGQEDVNFWTSAQKMTLNKAMYAPLRKKNTEKTWCEGQGLCCESRTLIK